MEFYKTRPILKSFVTLVLGILIIGGMFIYYAYDLGVKPCKGLPSDADNCGDGDFGGIYFILIGGPIALFGFIHLISSMYSYFKRNRL